MQINRNIKSSNFAVPEVPRNIEYVILHYTDQDFETSVESLCSKEKEVSAHYLIAENGEIFNLVDDKNVAWHAGTGNSLWHGKDYINTISIGIEIVNLGYGAFTNIQMESVIKLCHHIKDKYNIPRENFIGHSDIAPHRKLDPGIFFDWKRLSEEGIGIEFDKLSGLPRQSCAFPRNDEEAQFDISIIQNCLAKLGYKIEITGKLDKQTSDVIRAFQSHFCSETILKNQGIEGYRNYDTRYEWDEVSDRMLSHLLMNSGDSKF